MKTYQYICFDWDGCLVNTLDIWLDSYKEVFREFGVNPTDKEITEKVFGDWDGPLKVGITDLEKYYARLEPLVNKRLEQVPLFPGAKELLQKLHSAGKHLAIITTSTEEAITHPLALHDLRQYFEIIVSGDAVKKHKPDPEGIFKAMEFLNGNLQQAIMIGDSAKDLGAAQNAGIDSILFHTDTHEAFFTLESLQKYSPTHVVKSYEEMEKILL